MLTPVVSEILLFAYQRYMGGDPIVTPGEVARERNISRPAAQAHLKKLSERGMGRYLSNKGFAIDERGRRYCRDIIRNHRVLETYFCRVLGIPLNKACREAKKLQYYTSRELVDRLWKAAGVPTACPHGFEIPVVGGR